MLENSLTSFLVLLFAAEYHRPCYFYFSNSFYCILLYRGIEKRVLTNHCVVSSFDKTASQAVNKFKMFSTHMYLYCAQCT